MGGIRPEYWIECDKCGHEEVMVENAPSTGKMPASKKEAMEAAKTLGWKGSVSKPICPDCAKE